MGCPLSQNQKITVAHYPQTKERKRKKTGSSIAFGTQISTQPIQEQHLHSEWRDANDPRSLANVSPMLYNPSVSSPTFLDKDFKDREEVNIRKMTREESFREFSFKAPSDSMTSVDMRDVTFYRQPSGQLKGDNRSVLKLDGSVLQIRPSGFLINKAESKLKRFDSLREKKQTLGSEYKIKIETVAKSAENLENIPSSRSSIRNDSPTEMRISQEERDKVKNTAFSGNTNLAKHLLVVPEESRIDESIREEPSKQQGRKSILSDIDFLPTLENIKRRGSELDVKNIWIIPEVRKNNSPTLQFSNNNINEVTESITTTNQNIQNNSLKNAGSNGNTSIIVSKEPASSNPFEEYRINITNASSDECESYTYRWEPSPKNSNYSKSMPNHRKVSSENFGSKRFDQLDEPVKSRQDSFRDQLAKKNGRHDSDLKHASHTKKNETQDSKNSSNYLQQAVPTKSNSVRHIQNQLLAAGSGEAKQIPDEVTPRETSVEISKNTSSKSNRNLLDPNPNSPHKEEVNNSTTTMAISFVSLEKLKPKAQKKFNSNLLDLLAPKNKTPTNTSLKALSKVPSKVGTDYFEEVSNLSIRTPQRSPPTTNIRGKQSDEILYKFTEENANGGSGQDAINMEEWGATLVSKLQGLNNIDFMRETDTISPIASSLQQFHDTHGIPNKRPEMHLNFHKSFLDVSQYTEDPTIYDMEDDISNFDMDNYTFYENIREVEIDDNQGINVYEGTGYLRPQPPSNHQSIKMSRFGSRRGTLSKSKSVNYDELMSTSIKNSPVLQTRTIDQSGESQKLLRKYSKPSTSSNLASAGSGVSPLSANSTSETSPSNHFPTQLRKRLFKQGRQSKSQVIARDVDKSLEEERQNRLNQYVLKEDIGRGMLGEVKKAINTDTQNGRAVKIILKSNLKPEVTGKAENNNCSQLEMDLALLKKIDHQNIVKVYEVINDPKEDKLYFITELVGKGISTSQSYSANQLRGLLEEVKEENEVSTERTRLRSIPDEKARTYFRDLLSAIDYLHNTANVIHGNLKLENLLISSMDTLKISDYYITHLIQNPNNTVQNNHHTESFLPPESWLESCLEDKSVDIWGIGSLLYYFLYGKCPFTANSAFELRSKMLESEVEIPNLEYDPRIVKLIKACLQKDPNKRITLREIMRNPWVTKDGQEPLFSSEYERLEITEEDVQQALTQKAESSLSPSNNKTPQSHKRSRFSIQGAFPLHSEFGKKIS